MSDRFTDARMRLFSRLLLPGIVGHLLQLASEDAPWADWAEPRAWVTPGWHQYLPEWLPYVLLGALALAVMGLFVRPSKRWMLGVVLLYVGHYVSWPFRIRNHMTHTLFVLLAVGGALALSRSRPRDARGAERAAMTGVALVLCVTYAFAALHKVNAAFLSHDPALSSAIDGLTTFWIYGDLGSQPPRWAMLAATWGTVIIEACAPILAWRVRALRVPMILVLFAFHFPHVAVMNVADYPMLASVGYIALFDPAHARLVLAHARRPNPWNVSLAALGALLQLWFMPYGGPLMIFGIFVCALWGWGAGAMLRAAFVALRTRRRGARWPIGAASIRTRATGCSTSSNESSAATPSQT